MVIVLLFCLCIATKHYQVDGLPNLSSYDDLDLEKQLKVLNKPPIKTIQTEFGSIVDCIDINKQAAFDNPLLKNHKIQLKPSYEDTRTKVKLSQGSGSMIALSKDLCPKGTVPIPRTTKEDLIHANKISNLSRTSPGYHIAEIRSRYSRVLFGIQGTLSAYNPAVAWGQMSGAYIWLGSGPNGPNSNFIQAGWQVYPDLAKDTRTHFFASWSHSIPRKGCINFLCPGFVQVSRRLYLGIPIANVSTYNGVQFEMNLNFTQDPATGNWWLKAQNINVGYFPAALFNNEFLYATNGGWSGRTAVLYGNGGRSPPMGSGHFPDGNPQHACYISKIGFKDRNRQDHGPMRDDVWAYADNPVCYGVNYYDYVDDNLQRVLMLGGPGGDCGL